MQRVLESNISLGCGKRKSLQPIVKSRTNRLSNALALAMPVGCGFLNYVIISWVLL